MATLLGSATLNTTFTSTCGDVSLATSDLTRVTQTGYRTTVGGEAPFYDGGAYNKPQRAEVLYNDELAKYTEDDFIDSDYLELLDPDTDFVKAVATAGSPNSPGTADLFLYFDFLDIDPTATVSSIDVQVTLESTQGGYSSYAPYGAQDELHYGKVQAYWHSNGFTSSNTSSSGQVKITTDDRTTVDLTITRDAILGWGANTGAGEEHCMKVTFTGVVYDHAGTGFAYPGLPSLNVKIYNVRARANYTGRTRLTTDFKKPPSFTSTSSNNPQTISSTGYNFNLPTDALVEGSIIIYGGVGAEPDGTGQTWNAYTTGGNKGHRFTISGSEVTSVDYDRSVGNSFLWGQESTHPSNEGQWSADYLAYDYDGEAELTRAEAVDSNLTLESRYVGNFNSELLKPPYKGKVKLAFVLPVIGSSDITANTTLTATPVMVHGNTADEIDDFTTAVSVSALGGFLLEAVSNPSTAITTTPGTTIGLVRTGFTVAMSASFTVPDTTTQFAITAASFIFPSASVSCSAGVTFTTPATSSSAFTTTPGTAIGRIRTGFTIAVPSAFTTPALSDVLLVKAPNDKQVYTTPLDTRTHIIPEDDRTLALETETRTYIIPEDDRIHELETETRTTTPEALQ